MAVAIWPAAKYCQSIVSGFVLFCLVSTPLNFYTVSYRPFFLAHLLPWMISQGWFLVLLAVEHFLLSFYKDLYYLTAHVRFYIFLKV